MDADSTFSVGLIYGPSGCGKTSLVRAGLLPCLSANVVAVYCEASAEDTEVRLLHSLRKRCPELQPGHNLKEAMSALRQGEGIPPGKKVLLVIDQFEQWLHANREAQNPELVRALRQCDGGRVQCIVMVRDDFWLASTRFMQQLEIRLVEGQNSALVDLFDMEHARKVLTKFGYAYGRFPQVDEEVVRGEARRRETRRQEEEETSTSGDPAKDFVEQAVAELATEGKVVCVRLALFADMMKSKPWTPATLKEVGGTKGVGVAFLEETLSSATAPPQHRHHQRAARSRPQDLAAGLRHGHQGPHALRCRLVPRVRLCRPSRLRRPDSNPGRRTPPHHPHRSGRSGARSASRGGWRTRGGESPEPTIFLPIDARLPGSLIARVAWPQTEGNPARAGGASAEGAGRNLVGPAREPPSSAVVGVALSKSANTLATTGRPKKQE